ncbi:MAG: hypothetical protein ACFFDN_18550, partial [Candidatus Hodarchaeota archaeon]
MKNKSKEHISKKYYILGFLVFILMIIFILIIFISPYGQEFYPWLVRVARITLTDEDYKIISILSNMALGLIFSINGYIDLKKRKISALYELVGGLVSLIFVPILFILREWFPPDYLYSVLTAFLVFISYLLPR